MQQRPPFIFSNIEIFGLNLQLSSSEESTKAVFCTYVRNLRTKQRVESYKSVQQMFSFCKAEELSWGQSLNNSRESSGWLISFKEEDF